jgi:hypothetical protein
MYVVVCTRYIRAHGCICLYVHSTDTSVQLHKHTSLSIRPNQPCDSCESQLRAGPSPAERHPSCHLSPCTYIAYTLSYLVCTCTCTQACQISLRNVCGLIWYEPCIYIVYTLSYSVYTCTCIVHGCFSMFDVSIIHCCVYSVHTCLNCPCNRHVLCYHTGIQYPVQTVFSDVCKGYCRCVAFLWHFSIFPYKHVCQLLYLDKLSMYCE